MVQLTDLITELSSRRDLMRDTLEHFVSLESHTFDPAGVDAAADVLCAALEEAGFTIERRDSGELAQHRIARRAGRGTGTMLVLIHLDTVWPKGTLESWSWPSGPDTVSGPGALDMKGGWVVLLEAIRALDRQGWGGFAELIIYMGADEQVGSPQGRRTVLELAEAATWAIGMEPAPIQDPSSVVVRRAAVGSFVVDIAGEALHPVSGRIGASAIGEAARIITELHALADADASRFVNVGLVNGGTSRQVTAASAELAVGFRAPETHVARELLDRATAIVQCTSDPRITTAMRDIVLTEAYPEPTPLSEKLFDTVSEVANDLGITIRANHHMGAADTNRVAALGVPTIDGLGPEGGNSCAPGEYVDVTSFPRRIALLAGLLATLSASAHDDWTP